MKNNIFIKITGTTLIVLLSVFSIGTITNAQEATPTPSGSPSTSPARRPPFPLPIRTLENRSEANGQARNNLLGERQEIRKEASTKIKDTRTEEREQMNAPGASTNDMFKKGAQIRREMKTRMEARTFEIRKVALIKELNLSLNNISQISARIDTRIGKIESEGHDVTDVRALLVIANDKLAKAKVEVAAFQALTATSTSVTASTTTEVDLAKPRVAGDTAIKSVKEARDAFQKVIVALAHTLGIKPSSTPTPSKTN